MLTTSAGTIAIYMGRAAASDVARELIGAGRSPDMPVNDRRERVPAAGTDHPWPARRAVFLVEGISDDDPTLLLIGEAVGRNVRAAAGVPVEREGVAVRRPTQASLKS